MTRFLILFLATVPLAACATGEKPVVAAGVEVEKIAIPHISNEQNLAEMSLQNGLAPCPRFISSLDAAESAVNAAPKNYPHML
ncbi:MAG: hypothetical protein JWM96_689 [Alphaproteobacteria bacterium]|nr:hypothetical protein [Alphaproteobacteria bacterium]